MSLLAFDSTNSAFALDEAKQAGAEVAIRYFSLKDKTLWKTLKIDEARTLTAAGMAILPVFQFSGDRLASFSTAMGQRDAENALIAARTFKMPTGAMIFFAVDWNPSENQIRGNVIPHFRRIREVFEADGSLFRVGCYGSGLVCRMLAEEGLVELTWLAQAMGWRESRAYLDSEAWAMHQQMPTTTSTGEQFNFNTVRVDMGTLGAFIYDDGGSRLAAALPAPAPVPTPAPPPTPGPAPGTMSRPWPGIVFADGGDHPEDHVRAIQHRLNDHGYGPVAVDGDYGSATANQIRAFQARNDDPTGMALDIDGMVGKNTWWALFADFDVAPAATPPDAAKTASQNFLAIALSQDGVRETRPNRGPSIDAYIMSTGLAPWADAFPWCVAFVYWCAVQLEDMGGADNTLPKTAGVHAMWNSGRNSAPMVVTRASADATNVRPGMVFFLDTGGGRGHAGIVTRVVGEQVHTIEGNTNKAGSREGDGVYQRVRALKPSSLMGYIGFYD